MKRYKKGQGKGRKAKKSEKTKKFAVTSLSNAAIV